jgi:hypothetical protein
MEQIYFSETYVDFQRITRRYIPDYRNLHNNNCFHNQVSVLHETTCKGITMGYIIHTTRQIFCNKCDIEPLEHQIWMMLVFHTFSSEMLQSVFQWAFILVQKHISATKWTVVTKYSYVVLIYGKRSWYTVFLYASGSCYHDSSFLCKSCYSVEWNTGGRLTGFSNRNNNLVKTGRRNKGRSTGKVYSVIN